MFLFQIAWGHLTFVGIFFFFFFFLRKGYFHQVELKTDHNHLYLGGNPRVFYKKKKKPVRPGVASGMVMYFGPAVIWCCHAKLYLRLRSVTKPQLVTHLRGSFWRQRKKELGKIELKRVTFVIYCS